MTGSLGIALTLLGYKHSSLAAWRIEASFFPVDKSWAITSKKYVSGADAGWLEIVSAYLLGVGSTPS